MKKDNELMHLEWEIWKKEMLSAKERKNLSIAMFIDFLYSKGYKKEADSLFKLSKCKI
jgi:hypothetical protein